MIIALCGGMRRTRSRAGSAEKR